MKKISILFLKWLTSIRKRYQNYLFEKKLKKLPALINKMLQSNNKKEQTHLRKKEKNKKQPKYPIYKAIRFETFKPFIYKQDADLMLEKIGYINAKFLGLVVHPYTFISKSYLKYEISDNLYILFQLGRSSFYITDDKVNYYQVTHNLSNDEPLFRASFLLNDRKKHSFCKNNNTGYATIYYKPGITDISIQSIVCNYSITPDKGRKNQSENASCQKYRNIHIIREYITYLKDDKSLNKFGSNKLINL